MSKQTETETGFTPGPWAYYNRGWIMTDARAWGRQITCMFYGEQSERVANGHLIAAAPAMYQALQAFAAIEQSCEGKGLLDLSVVDLQDAYKLARAALAQAQGKPI